MDDKDFCSPSIGEIIRAIFNSTGLLPTKGHNAFLSESEKKSLQMQLKRLADENSKIDGKLNELLLCLQSMLQKVLIEDRLVCVFMAAVDELLMVYKYSLRQEGTYLSKRDTIKYLIATSLCSRLVISFAKNFLVYNVPSLKLPMPFVQQWILPLPSSKGLVRWPLALVWEHIYMTLNMSQSAFHNPRGVNGDYRERQHLENAQRWCNGNQLPSVDSLLANFDNSVSLHMDGHFELTDKQKNSFKLMLFMARVSTYFFQALQKHFGTAFLWETTNYIRKFSKRVGRFTNPVWQSACQEFAALTKGERALPLAQDHFFYNYITYCWQDYAMVTDQSCQYFKQLELEGALEHLEGKAKYRLYLDVFGPINSYMFLDQQRVNAKIIPPAQFLQMFSKGMQLKNSIQDLGQAEEFEKELKKTKQWSSLAWLSSWCFANYYYRQGNNVKAYQHYKDAFTNAKYRAGSNQYKLVNQYIEACAKHNQYAEMKKGVAWANYMGFEVRWLRGFDNPESEETLRGLFELFAMDKMRYANL